MGPHPGVAGVLDTGDARSREAVPGDEQSAPAWPCQTNPDHGPLRRRDHPGTERAWCGEWFDCTAPGCRMSMLVASDKLLSALDDQERMNARRGRGR